MTGPDYREADSGTDSERFRADKQSKKLDKLPEDEKNTIPKVINALIRDFNAR